MGDKSCVDKRTHPVTKQVEIKPHEGISDVAGHASCVGFAVASDPSRA
jgi:hypothetical protein